ncbi:MAG: DUF4118 domain-containing protein [Coriobacteriia bacterium]|nr:DUF4118 domain-containing protein [Coriobacteriia bacterium]
MTLWRIDLRWRIAIALALPFVALVLQLALWPWVQPAVYFFFFPAIFFAASLGGRRAAVPASLISSLLVLYFFLPPRFSWNIHPGAIATTALFVAMGYLFGDVYDRLNRQTQIALAASEEKYQLLFETLQEGVAYCEMILDDEQRPVDWRYLEVNPAYGHITGVRDIVGRLASDAFPGILEANPQLLDSLGRVAALQEPAEFDEYLPLSTEPRWLHISATSPSSGRFVMALADITDRKLAEEAIRNLNVMLEKRVEQRTAEVTAANTELEAFAYAVSHDLRAPLRAMSGFSQALVEDCAAGLDAQGRDYLEHIVAASRNMGELIDALLLLSRTTRGEMTRDAIDISAMATSLLEERRAGKPGRIVEATVEPGLTTFGDLRMVESLMRNLIGNAWKYSKNREVAHIDVTSADIDGKRWICVTDDGAGFDPAYSDQLFKPFRRLHRQDEFAGIGIGLATVQRVVARHGGEIRAQGEVDRGAKFCFRLPDPAEKLQSSATTAGHAESPDG